MPTDRPVVSRRRLLAGGGALAFAAVLPRLVPAQAAPLRDVTLTARAGRAQIVPPPDAETAILGFDGIVPGPEIRLRQGDRLRVAVHNALTEDTTVHFHGIRLPIAMDGVPHLTQAPIAPGDLFVYEFLVPDAGTYWYHPHVRSFEQIDRGLYGALIVEERAPPEVDRDMVWIVDDWRLDRNAAIAGDFGSRMDVAHGGRMGNTVTINGRVPEPFRLRTGERIRLRIVNAANARHFALSFEGHQPRVIAWDGQPVEPHELDNGRVVLGPAMRADLILDATGTPGMRYRVIDDFYPSRPYRLVDLSYGDRPPLRDRPPAPPPVLPPNTMPEPDLRDPIRHEILLMGGMMGRMTHATVGGARLDARALMRRGKAWAINGIVADGHHHPPLFILPRDRTCVLAMINDTAWPHPMHLHGFAMKVIARNGRPPPRAEWRDTVLLMPGDRVDTAFVADNPGDWMFHCHIPEHMEGGMMGVIRVD